MRNRVGLWVLVFLIFMSVPFSYGEKKEGKSGAFDFVESVPADSAENVELDGEIKLLFNKNVINSSVKDNNEKCFSIKDAQNEEVPIDVIFADDQIEPDKKREIILKPKEPFDEDTAYTIHISPMLQAKNGDNLDRDVSISFTTLSSQSDKDSPSPEDKSVENDTAKSDVTGKEGDTGSETDTGADGTEEGTGEQEDSNAKKYIWIAVLGVVLVLVLIFRKKQ